MVNWKTIKTVNMIVLGVVAAVLFGLGGIVGIDSLSDKVFNIITWSQLLGAGIIYVIYSFNKMLQM